MTKKAEVKETSKLGLEPWPEMDVHVQTDLVNRIAYIKLRGGSDSSARLYHHPRTERKKQIGDCLLTLDESNRVVQIEWKPFEDPAPVTDNPLEEIAVAVLKRQYVIAEILDQFHLLKDLRIQQQRLIDLVKKRADEGE